jgi:UDP-GlcNAc:undecaprenyl-phosphate GlcNAc-1-phosphate transferase
MACVWLLAVPLIDMARVMFVRRVRGRSLFEADREHLHHRLLDRGLSPGQAALALGAASIACGAAGLGAWRAGVPDWAMFYAFVALTAIVLGRAWARELAARPEDGRER